MAFVQVIKQLLFSDIKPVKQDLRTQLPTEALKIRCSSAAGISQAYLPRKLSI